MTDLAEVYWPATVWVVELPMETGTATLPRVPRLCTGQQRYLDSPTTPTTWPCTMTSPTSASTWWTAARFFGVLGSFRGDVWEYHPSCRFSQGRPWVTAWAAEVSEDDPCEIPPAIGNGDFVAAPWPDRLGHERGT